VYSVETVGKKASFQQQAKIELRLDNFQVINRRVEAIPVGDLPCGGAEGVISRAFASLVDFVGLAGHLVGEGGALYAMKGVLPEAEIAALPMGWRVDAVQAITVPGLGAERCLVVLRR
jgi:16S rRNA (guanine527-N7)-methyltransferase